MEKFGFIRTYSTNCIVEEKILVEANSKEEALKKLEDSVDIPYLGSEDDELIIADYKIIKLNTDEEDKEILDIKDIK